MTAQPPPRLSIIVTTYNRCRLLRLAIESLFAGSRDRDLFEVIVVDNGSTDATRETVGALIAAGRPLRYIVDPRKGVSYPRNTGVAEARGSYVAFMDDDQEAYPGWPETVVRTLDEHPDVDFLGGPVEPLWTGTAPNWITPAIQGAVTIIEWGASPREISPERWMCLTGGNCAFRRDVITGVGGWRPYRRSQDRELTVRLLLAGHRGIYVPEMRMRHHVEADRVNRAYFRRWNAMEGRMRAGYRFEELFDRDGRIRPPEETTRQLAGVPLYLYRRALTEFGGYVTALASRRHVDAFEHELKLRYFGNYIWARLRGGENGALGA